MGGFTFSCIPIALSDFSAKHLGLGLASASRANAYLSTIGTADRSSPGKLELWSFPSDLSRVQPMDQ